MRIDVPLDSDELHLLRLALLAYNRNAVRDTGKPDPFASTTYVKINHYRKQLLDTPAVPATGKETP